MHVTNHPLEIFLWVQPKFHIPHMWPNPCSEIIFQGTKIVKWGVVVKSLALMSLAREVK